MTSWHPFLSKSQQSWILRLLVYYAYNDMVSIFYRWRNPPKKSFKKKVSRWVDGRTQEFEPGSFTTKYIIVYWNATPSSNSGTYIRFGWEFPSEKWGSWSGGKGQCFWAGEHLKPYILLFVTALAPNGKTLRPRKGKDVRRIPEEINVWNVCKWGGQFGKGDSFTNHLFFGVPR